MRYPNTKHRADYIPRLLYSEYQLMYKTDMTASRDKIYKLEDIYERTAENALYYEEMIEAIQESKPFLKSSAEPINHNIWLSRRQTSDIISTCSPIDKSRISDEERFTRPLMPPIIREGIPIIPRQLLWERNVILTNKAEIKKAIKVVEGRIGVIL